MAPHHCLSAFLSLLLLSLPLTNAAVLDTHYNELAKRTTIPTDLPTGWQYSGCWIDNANGGRILSIEGAAGSTMTVESCVNTCIGDGYTVAGVEYSQECYCGNAIIEGGAKTTDSSCAMTCAGNANEVCGGPNLMSIYNTGTLTTYGVPKPNPSDLPTGWTYEGCFVDNAHGGRILGFTYGASASMTIEKCIADCSGDGYSIAGVEYMTECYCGNSIINQGALASADSDCAQACGGNPGEVCGGPNLMSLYTNGKAPPPVSSSSATVTAKPSTTSAAAVPSATGTPTDGNIKDLPTGWKYGGCYIDNANGGRILPTQLASSNTMTVESCISSCLALDAGYTVAGLEYSTQCFCGTEIIDGGALASSDSQCAMTCGGNPNEICGGPNLMSIFYTGTLTTLQPPAQQTSGLPGSWVYKGCLTDNNLNGISEPTLRWKIEQTTNNDATTCLSQCSAFGYEAGGMEYGEECYCGDPSDIQRVNATFVPDSECNTVCSGDPRYFCGAGNLLSFYEWNGPILTQWATPSGSAMGEYQFLIGGVVVPLMTTQGINGKIVFNEKWGTGPPNTTGTYELDLAQINNFTGAWRPLHVKTDIFCSTGLVLPDRAGRQINLGGWSGTSTFGVRLYTPSGSPGVWGNTDWQENAAEVHLQQGRWYPSSMIMPNGSILVVGGEDGSNGPPVPTLEVLPQPAGGYPVYAAYLNRTDPNNLYPFLTVVPSGKIFIGYYNEAALLDPGTLQPVVQLPNIPGAVNNAGSGRSYPLEGTMLVMPMSAPFTAPMTIMVCGGSSTGASQPLDNCASIQPDVAGSEWVIERMPSVRVMPCVAALPDGTFLIMNGGLNGVAGFGLSTIPNLVAILYDPTKAVGQRFSILASTIVARLYHSEALLLQDGRVLVSGSDPEENINPQEYRVEVFMPPYLLNGQAQPTFNPPAQQFWANGGTYTITGVNFTPSKISLVGAESSTHGNSFGQRVLFPAFSCSGTTCTITAPPANVAPPGWFHLFVLNGPTPSHSTWVQIGGDPAQLGNWPSGLPDFTPPGVN